MRDIDDAACRALPKLFYNSNYQNARGKMMVIVSFTIGRKRTTYATAEHNVDSMNLLKAGVCNFVLHGRHQHHFTKMLPDKDGVEQTAERLRMHY